MKAGERQARAKAAGRLCVCDGCENGRFQRQRCIYHHRLLRAEERAAEGKTCRVDGCDRGWFARGLCRGHYTTEYSRERQALAREQATRDTGQALP